MGLQYYKAFFCRGFLCPSCADSALIPTDIWLLAPENRWETSALIATVIIILHGMFASDMSHHRAAASDLKGEILRDRRGWNKKRNLSKGSIIWTLGFEDVSCLLILSRYTWQVCVVGWNVKGYPNKSGCRTLHCLAGSRPQRQQGWWCPGRTLAGILIFHFRFFWAQILKKKKKYPHTSDIIGFFDGNHVGGTFL